MLPSQSIIIEKLTRNELYYIRMIMLGFSKKKKKSFFGTDDLFLMQLKANIEFKLKTDNWGEVMSYVIRENLVKITDYKNSVLEKFVLNWVKRKITLWTYDIETSNFFVLKSKLKKLSYDIELNSKNSYLYMSDRKITNQELVFVNFKFSGLKDDLIASKLKVNARELESIRIDLFNKLRKENWLLIFRYFYQIGFIGKENSVAEKYIDETACKINAILKSTIRLEYKILSIYEAILIAFISIELIAVFKRNYKHSELSF